jgi:transcriptional regulator with XRE-family HTH domain
MTINDRFHSRLQEVALLKKKSQADIARDLGKGPSTVNKWWNGDIVPGFKNLASIAAYFGCDANWLDTGEGEPFPDTRRRDADRSDSFGRVNSGMPLELTRSRGQESLDQDFSIEEMLSDTRAVLESDTVYRQALASNIRAFKQAVINEGKMKNTDEKIDQMMKQIEALTSIVLQGQSGTNEKKRAGNDL